MKPFKICAALLLMLMVFVLLAACAGQQSTLPPPDTSTPELERTVTVQVAVENLRATPNGSKVGETTSGSEHVFVERRGNWVQVKEGVRDDVWIWAPSVGFHKVNPLAVSTWIGGGQPQTVDSLTSIVGLPDEVEQLGGELYLYRYLNQHADREGTLFGTSSFNVVELIVDRVSREVLGLEMELPPFSGSAKELLRAVGLPEVRSTKTNFEHALYMNKLEFTFVAGDFNKIQLLTAQRYASDAFANALISSEKKIVHEGNQLMLSMEVTSTSGEYAFAALDIDVELVEGDRKLGMWTLSNLNVRIEPGERELVYEALPLSDAGIDVNRVAARAEIVGAVTVPAGVVSQP